MECCSRRIIWSIKEDVGFCTTDEKPFDRTSILQTDTSGISAGAVLSQGVNGDQPIAYFSIKLLPREN